VGKINIKSLGENHTKQKNSRKNKRLDFKDLLLNAKNSRKKLFFPTVL
jgi:hypothetical protein